MDNIKKPNLDIDDFNGYAVNPFSGKHPSEVLGNGHKVSVRQNKHEISLEIILKDGGSFVGKIICFDAPKDKYTDLEIGDKILFKKENITSVP